MGGRYSFGAASTSGGMLHLRSFTEHLLNGACSKLYPLLEQIFHGGWNRGFLCTGAGGDFVLDGTASDQDLHSDIQVQKGQDVWCPPPMLSVNFAVQPLTCMNGPTRIIPGTQLDRGRVPDPLPHDWSRSCVCPLPAGSVIIRDVRVLHSGTRNLTRSTRYLPSIEFVSADFRWTNRRDCFPPFQCLPYELFQELQPQIKELCAEIAVARGCTVRPSYLMS